MPSMSSSLSMFSIESNSAERDRASLEKSLSRELEQSGMNFGHNNDDGESSSDEQFMGGMSSLLLRDQDLDEGISAAGDELDAALNELDGAVSTTSSSIVESIELGRGLPTGSPEEPLFSTTARKTSQRTSPSEMHRHISTTSFSPVQPKQQTTRRAYSQSTPKRATSLEVITERSLSDLNRPRSPAESRFGNKRISAAKIPTSFKNTQDLLMSLGMNTEENDKKLASARQDYETVASAHESGDDPSIRLPDITGISSLISNGDTKMSFGKFKHKNIGSIPISDDDQAILSALRTMQERIQKLETKNASYRTAVMSLESELRQARKQHELATSKAKYLEQQLEQRRRETVGSITPADKQKIQKALEKERQSWHEKQSILKLRIESLERELSLQNMRHRRVEDERNETVKSLAEALEEIDRLKEVNNNLKSQLRRGTQTNDAKIEKLSTKQRLLREARNLKKSKALNTYDVDEEDFGVPVETNDETVGLEPVSKTTTRRESIARNKSTRVTRKKPSKVQSSKLRSTSSSRHKPNKERIEESESEDVDDDDLSSSDVSYADDVSDVESAYSDASSVTEQVSRPHRKHQTKGKRHSTGEARSRNAKPEVQARTVYVDDIPRPNVNMRKAMDSISQHDPALCTVCSRRRYRKYQLNNKEQPLWQYATATAPQDQPEHREHWEEENTIRPSMRPENAVTTVLSQLEDEFRHLKFQYQSHVDKYEHLDPAVSKRKRKALVTRLKEIIEELETKADQIYALYDVLESTGMGPRPWLGGEMSA
ncbi:centrosome microtubule-binding domain of Cep57-domain-containing protein [Lipomyces chichibuensis]|uniref:centrosome microtubule-binding domain of Cep57-domain-containing protein n=1 Tax=Lipomyces chichibuensis TaxID=1546026 RepID=UPI0033441D47